LTPSGKVDRRALPPVVAGRRDVSETYEGARTAVEELLVGVWCEVLRLEWVGIHDNFFELGGDSILSLQIVAKAQQAGLHLLPQQLFKHQTVAELAVAAGEAQLVSAEQGLVTGVVPLTPIQQWFFAAQPVEPQHFNQAVMFALQERADPALMETAVRHLFAHHDALRLRFVLAADGWRQFNAGAEEAVPFARVDLSGLSGDAQRAALEAAADEIQRSLNLTRGPIGRVTLFAMGAGKTDRLLIVIHHLAVDGVSWRILLEDLQTVYAQLRRGVAVKLPRKTTSYKQWAERLAEYAAAESLTREAAYWLDERRRQVRPLPLDHQTGVNSVGSARKVFASLDAEETRALLQEVPAAHRTQVNDALLTALVQALARWSGARRLLVNLEGHGREDVGAAVNLLRTVGWFTTIFPVLFEVEATDDAAATLKLVKEQLRAVPQHGLGYGLLRYARADRVSAELRALPEAEVLFNYLGQFDSVLTGAQLFSAAEESSGATQSAREQRRHVLELNASVADGRLQMTWTYSEHLHRRETVERLAADYVQVLRALTGRERAQATDALTPADFPEARLSQKELDKFLGQFKQGKRRAR
jgi:non-ribosomal peptide synthase protein (TIGR01720 family)